MGFIDNRKEYEIENMYPKRPWMNYLWNEEYIMYINQFGIGKTIMKAEKGTYRFFVGNSSKNTVECEYTYNADEDIITAQLSELCPPRTLTKRLTADGSYSEAVNTSRERIMFDCGYGKGNTVPRNMC